MDIRVAAVALHRFHNQFPPKVTGVNTSQWHSHVVIWFEGEGGCLQVRVRVRVKSLSDVGLSGKVEKPI